MECKQYQNDIVCSVEKELADKFGNYNTIDLPLACDTATFHYEGTQPFPPSKVCQDGGTHSQMQHSEDSHRFPRKRKNNKSMRGKIFIVNNKRERPFSL